jgi:hypothetical protein
MQTGRFQSGCTAIVPHGKSRAMRRLGAAFKNFNLFPTISITKIYALQPGDHYFSTGLCYACGILHGKHVLKRDLIDAPGIERHVYAHMVE